MKYSESEICMLGNTMTGNYCSLHSGVVTAEANQSNLTPGQYHRGHAQRLYLCRGPFKELLSLDAGDVEHIVCVRSCDDIHCGESHPL